MIVTRHIGSIAAGVTLYTSPGQAEETRVANVTATAARESTTCSVSAASFAVQGRQGLEQPFGARDRGGQAVDSAKFRLTLGTAPLAKGSAVMSPVSANTPAASQRAFSGLWPSTTKSFANSLDTM